MLGLLHVTNMEKLILRIKKVDEEHKQQLFNENLSRQNARFNS
jgi:hypothetical protein